MTDAIRHLDLAGHWQLQLAGTDRWIPARVPGCVHLDLLAAGHIEDPHFRDNELRQQWIGEEDWIYKRRFRTPKALRECRNLKLCCDGLDTLASIQLNGTTLGRANNMFRCWTFDVTGKIEPGWNELEIRFASPLRYVRRQQTKRRLYGWNGIQGAGWLRKQPCNFGWDWGPTLVTSGVRQAIWLEGVDAARLADVWIRQSHAKRRVQLNIQAQLDPAPNNALRLRASVRWKGRVIHTQEAVIRGATGDLEVEIAKPRLWWPNGMGDQPLYDVTVELLDARDRRLDQVHRSVGLRTLELQQKRDRWGQSFAFVVNGRPFFAKGANWIPADTFFERATPERYAHLLESAAQANMNMIRAWGGGIYEPGAFFDHCDRLGLLVWQDFMFACGHYPAFDADWLENVRAEAEHQVRRLRGRTCLAAWCGNNELEQNLVGEHWSEHHMGREDYRHLTDTVLRGAVRRHDPDVAWIPASPHTPGKRPYDANDNGRGDAHLWSVWHGGEPFQHYRSEHPRFCSEFGFQSFPHPRTVEAFTLPEDRNLTSPVMEHHQRSPVGNVRILQHLAEWFRWPASFADTLQVSQMLQAIAMQIAVEHWRRGMPRTMGALYWQLNDVWPGASWSSIDSAGRWKALHYAARRFFATLLLSGVENLERGTVEVHVTSDLAEARAATVRWTVTDVPGTVLAKGSLRVRTPRNGSRRVVTLKLRDHIEARGPNGVLVWLDLVVSRRIVSRNMVALAPPKQWALVDPQLRVRTTKVGRKQMDVTVTSRHSAFWVHLESTQETRFDDNYFHLRAGEHHVVRAQAQKSLAQSSLEARSLFETSVEL